MQETQNKNLVKRKVYTYNGLNVEVTRENEPSDKAITAFNTYINKNLHKLI